MVNDSISEKISTTIVTTGMILHTFPKAPSTNIIGEKVTIVVKTANITGFATWYAPSNAASGPLSPLFLNICMFSPTTIASSTTIPSTRMKVNSEIILMETSKIGRSQNPPINEIGMPNETQPASFGLRNKASTTSTNDKPRAAFSTNKSILPLRITDSSFIELNDIPGGIVGRFFFK